MPTKEELEALVKMLDGRMASGSGHVNVKVNKDGKAEIEMEEVSVVSGMDCDSGDTACKIPNLHMDDDDEY